VTIAHRFGESPPLSVGVEEELMIVDGESLRLEPRVADIAGEANGGTLKSELFASVVEATTGIHETPAGAIAALTTLRRSAVETAARRGLRIMATGSHPISLPEDQEIVPEERYRSFVEYAGVSARFQGVNGLHVHVGMPDPDACYRVLEGVLPWLPAVLAVSANSPYFAGRETGLLSSRAPVLAQLPRAGAPPPFGSYAAWEAWVERLGRLGVAADHTRIWWDLRPAPQFGTLEIRIPDQPTSIERTAALVELVVELCRRALEGDLRLADRGDYSHNRWAAMRFGPDAELIHPDGDRLVRAAELAPEVDGCEAHDQLELGRTSGLDAVCAELVERSVPSAPR
jgi:carboxylate-amine ligase